MHYYYLFSSQEYCYVSLHWRASFNEDLHNFIDVHPSMKTYITIFLTEAYFSLYKKHRQISISNRNIFTVYVFMWIIGCITARTTNQRDYRSEKKDLRYAKTKLLQCVSQMHNIDFLATLPQANGRKPSPSCRLTSRPVNLPSSNSELFSTHQRNT